MDHLESCNQLISDDNFEFRTESSFPAENPFENELEFVEDAERAQIPPPEHPPLGLFKSRDNIRRHLDVWGRDHGQAFAIGRSREKGNAGLKRVIFISDKGGRASS